MNRADSIEVMERAKRFAARQGTPRDVILGPGVDECWSPDSRVFGDRVLARCQPNGEVEFLDLKFAALVIGKKDSRR